MFRDENIQVEDDGVRIDEADAGSIDVVLRQVEANGNDGQGLQVTENETGDILLAILGPDRAVTYPPGLYHRLTATPSTPYLPR